MASLNPMAVGLIWGLSPFPRLKGKSSRRDLLKDQ